LTRIKGSRLNHVFYSADGRIEGCNLRTIDMPMCARIVKTQT
jgi:hypothetical protein